MPSETNTLHSAPLFLKNVRQNEQKHHKPAPSLYTVLFRITFNKAIGNLVNITDTRLFLYGVGIPEGKLTVPSHQRVTSII